MGNANSPWVWVVMATLAGGLSPLIAPFNRDREAARTENRRILATMNEAQRKQLQQNYDEFSRMSEQEREKIRTFHLAMAEDHEKNSGKTAKVLDDYLAWVQTIPPYKRRQLEATDSPSIRLGFISTLLKLQQEEVDHRLLAQEAIGRRERVDIPRLTTRELEEVMTVLERDWHETWNADQNEKLKDLMGLERWIAVLEFEEQKDKSNFRPTVANAASQALLNHASEDVRRNFEDFQKNAKAAAIINGLSGQRPNPNFLSIAVLVCNLSREIEKQDLDRSTLSDELLTQEFQKLDDDHKKQLFELSSVDFKDRLRQYLLTETPRESHRKIFMKLIHDPSRPKPRRPDRPLLKKP